MVSSLFIWRAGCPLEPVRLFRERIGQFLRKLVGLVLPQAMFGNEAREKCAIDPARHVVAGRYGRKGAGVVIEADGVVEAGRLGGHLAETAHALRAVVEPPGRPELQRRVDAGQRRQLARVARFVQREDDDGEVALGADAVEQRLQRR